MATLKLKKPAMKTAGRPPLRGRGVAPRPTRSQAEAARERRDAATHGGERRSAAGDRPRHEAGPAQERRGGGAFGPRRDAPGGDRPAVRRDERGGSWQGPRRDERGGAWQGPRRDEGAGPRRDAGGHRDERGGARPGDRRDERAGPPRGGPRDERRAPRPAGGRDTHAGPHQGRDRDERGTSRHEAGPGRRADDRRPPAAGAPRAWPGEHPGPDPRRPPGERRDARGGAGSGAWHDARRDRPADHGGAGGHRDDRGDRHRDDRPAAPGRGPRDDRRGTGPAGPAHGAPYGRRPAPRDDRPPRRADAPAHGPARRHDEAPHGHGRPHDREAPRGGDSRRPPRPDARHGATAGGRPQPGWPRRDDRPRPPGPPPRQGRDEDADDDFEPVPHAEGSLRLSKRMVQLGLASRREADEWIEKGWVRVDGKAVSKLGARVLPEQRITLDPRASSDQAQRVTILLNKPAGHVSGQAEDGNEPAIALVKAQTQWAGDDSGRRFEHVHLRGIAPAGRLDLESTGLLVFTQDGRIAKQLIGEDSEIEKEYLVRVEPARADAGAPPADAAPLPSDEDLALLRHGLELDGEPLRPAEVDRLDDGRLRFVLKQGKKRQIRRMCEAVGLKVTALERVRIGGVRLGELPPGRWRYLRDDEAFG